MTIHPQFVGRTIDGQNSCCGSGERCSSLPELEEGSVLLSMFWGIFDGREFQQCWMLLKVLTTRYVGAWWFLLNGVTAMSYKYTHLNLWNHWPLRRKWICSCCHCPVQKCHLPISLCASSLRAALLPEFTSILINIFKHDITESCGTFLDILMVPWGKIQGHSCAL